MNGETLTEEEQVFLAAPIALAPDELAGYGYGCDSSAVFLIPGAALCFGCALRFGVDSRNLPLDELTGDERWREARTLDYLERLRALPPRRRDERAEATLARLAERQTAALLDERPAW